MHAHIYPDKIAAKAVNAIKEFYDLPMANKEGTVANLKSLAEEAGVVKVVVHSVATLARQVESINTFVAREAAKDKLFLPFATLHPDMTKQNIKNELNRLKEMGIKGIKLHPDFQEFSIDGDAAGKILDCLDGSLPIQMHTGDKRKNFSSPLKMMQAAKRYPHLRFIAAHFGGWSEWEYAEGYEETPNVFFDTSSTLEFLDKDRAKEIIDYLGADRFMFGTDYPMWDYKGELNRIKALGLPSQTLEKILYTNAVKFMNLEL